MDEWISENENLSKAIRRLSKNYDIDFSFFEDLVGAKSHNNKVGMYRFQSNGIVKNIYVYPKVIRPLEDEFISYIDRVLELISKYPSLAKMYRVDKSLLDLAVHDSRPEIESSKDIIHLYYQTVIGSIIDFFSKHESSIKKHRKVFSTSLDYDLDLYENISNIKKTELAQIKKETSNYSYFAAITLSTLNKFLRQKKGLITKDIDRLAKLAIGKIKKKYNLTKAVKYTELFKSRSRKKFRSKKELILYSSLMKLLGLDRGLKGENKAFRLDELSEGFALFFPPEIFYEVEVYHQLISVYGFDSVEIKPSKPYQLQSRESQKSFYLRSEPDFIIKHGGETVVIDAKWKILDSLDSSFMTDYMKLYRDRELFNSNKMMLVYPVVSDQVGQSESYLPKGFLDAPAYIELVPMKLL